MHHHRLIMRALTGLSLAGALTLFSNCAGPKATTTTSTPQGSSYSEDLSGLRPKVEVPATTSAESTSTNGNKKPAYVEPKLTVNKPLETVLDSISQINLNRKYIEGFSIQVFAGRKDDALNVKKQIAHALPDLICDVQFAEPIYRVKVGKYYTRLDAQEDYAAVKRYFTAAIIVPEKISLN